MTQSKEIKKKLTWIKIVNPFKSKINLKVYSFCEKDQKIIQKFLRQKFSSAEQFEKLSLKFLKNNEHIKLFTQENIKKEKEEIQSQIDKSQEKINTILNTDSNEKIDVEQLKRELTWDLFSLDDLFEWTFQEEEQNTTSIFWINRLFSLKLVKKKNDYITLEEYNELIWTYWLFFKSYQVNDDWKYFEKTVRILLEEMIACANYFKLDKYEFFKDCWVNISTIKDPSLLKKLNSEWKKHYMYNEFLQKEIYDVKSDKLKTEIVMKILLFKNDIRKFAHMLYNKMHWMMQNTNIKLLISEKFDYYDFENLFVFELIKWVKWYREKLFNWHWHKTKLMSYIDRILRNLAWTMNQRIVLDQELYWKYAQPEEWEEWDQIVDYLWWYDTINEDEIYFDFSKWWYMIRYIDQSSTELLNDFIKKFHYYKFEEENISLILNLQWYYFFEKVLKTYDLHWKIINSYFDLIVLLKKYWKLTYQQMKDLLLFDDTLKFWVLWMNWENYNKLIIYEFSTIKIKNLMKEKCSDDEIKRFFWKYNWSVKLLIDIIYWKKKINNKVNFFEIIKWIYTVMRWFEKLFIDYIYEKILEDHNLKLTEKLIQSKKQVFINTYKEEKEYSKKVYERIQKIINIHKSKKWRKNDFMKYFKKELDEKLLSKNKIRQYLYNIYLSWKKKSCDKFDEFESILKAKEQYFTECADEIINDWREEVNENVNLENINMILNKN